MPCDLLSNAKITGPPIGTHSLLVLCTGYYFDLSFNALFDPCFYIVRVLQRRGGGGTDHGMQNNVREMLLLQLRWV